MTPPAAALDHDGSVSARFARRASDAISGGSDRRPPIDAHSLADLLRSGWCDVEPVLREALERGALDAEAVVRALSLPPEGPAGAVVQLFPNATPRMPDTTAPPLRFELLGGLTTFRGDEEIKAAEWGRPMAARIVAFLLVHRDRAVPEDLLLEAFWPDATAASARRSLQVAVSRARQVLDPPGAKHSLIEYAHRTYRLQLREHDIVDTEEFERRAHAALALPDGPGRRNAIEAAVRAWTGEPLPGHRYEEWTLAWRARLTDRRAELLGSLVEARSEAGDHAAAIDAARELVAHDPLDEAAHRQLMTAYARAGRPAHALSQFLVCRQVMVDELGVEPSQAMSALQQRLLNGEAV